MSETRFDGTDPKSRRELFADAIDAHRTRESPFLTLEVDPETLGGDHPDAETDSNTGPDPELGIPWIQVADDVINLDCTEDELEGLKELLSEFPACTIDELNRPEEAEGVNVRVNARTDGDRIASFLEETFRRVYGLDASYRVWVVAI